MLIIPLHKKIDWKHPPLITLLFVAANILIFVLFQWDDDEEVVRAVEFYDASGLSEIERPLYLAYLTETGDTSTKEAIEQWEPDEPSWWVLDIQMDPAFLSALHAGQVIRPGDPGYWHWWQKRLRFEALYTEITFVGYGLKPAEPTPVTLVSHMFLHGDLAHLIGNMIFLLAVGLLVEATLDRKTFLLLYLLVGIGSGLFFAYLQGPSLTPLVGASGAISGLMGSYAVFYGLRKVRFFYFLGVYFDYVSLPALVLLPLWIGNEVVQMQLNPGSNVAYGAHLGGLIVGALLAYGLRRLPVFSLEQVESEEGAVELVQRLEKARALCAAFEYDQALPSLRRLHAEHPDNIEVMALLYRCARLYPASEEYHRVAHRILSLEANDRATGERVRETFRDYARQARPRSRLSSGLICRLGRRFVMERALQEAEILMKFIVAKRLPCPEREALLQRFAGLLAENGRGQEAVRYRRLAGTAE